MNVCPRIIGLCLWSVFGTVLVACAPQIPAQRLGPVSLKYSGREDGAIHFELKNQSSRPLSFTARAGDGTDRVHFAVQYTTNCASPSGGEISVGVLMDPPPEETDIEVPPGGVARVSLSTAFFHPPYESRCRYSLQLTDTTVISSDEFAAYE